MTTFDIKRKFGGMLRTARDAKKISRATLAIRLGISPKTIQSWEEGRTFIEDLALIPSIEAELGVSVWNLAAKATSSKRLHPTTEALPRYTAGAKSRAFAGPVEAKFKVHTTPIGKIPESDLIGGAFASVPLILPTAMNKDVSQFDANDTGQHIVIPAEWIPSGGVVIAYRMRDSSMVPMIPLGGIVIIDQRPLGVAKGLNRVVVLDLQGKGIRIRRLQEDPLTGDGLVGAAYLEGHRGSMLFREERGDKIIGRVIGILAEPT